MKFFKATLSFCLLLATPIQAVADTRPGDDIEFIKQSALGIDKLIASFYRKKNLSVPAVTDDATFMRRAFLVSIGRIPTAEEGLAFLEINDDAKREELVAYLMKSPGYSSHMSNWAFDLLRIRDRKAPSNFVQYREWVRQAMIANMPWDDFVNELVSAEGNGWDPKTGAVGYYAIDRGMPLDNLANTMRIFLGKHMECAQCHDDPFSETERMDFYNLAAFTAGQGSGNRGGFRDIFRDYRSMREEDRLGYEVTRLIRDQIYSTSIQGGGKGRIKLPRDYQYRDGQPGEYVGGRTPFGKRVRTSDRKNDGSGKKQFAEWITMKTGPQFPGLISNRMWERIMGKGIYDPVDVYVEADETVYPELTRFVTKLMVDLDYDLRAFQHVLLLTKTFQFATNPNPSSIQGADDFHGRKIERLTAEQVWDSLITLADGDPDKKPLKGLDTRIPVLGEAEILRGKDMTEFSNEILSIESEEELRPFIEQIIASVRKSRANGPRPKSSMMRGNTGSGYQMDSPVRASELPSPAPPSHFLYVFGASSRMVVEGASLEPNVGQILSMMNGYVQRQLVNNSGAHLYRSLEGASSDEEKIRRLYVAILNRPPNKEEMGWMKAEIEADGDEGFRNIVSALVMSSEFLFLQ